MQGQRSRLSRINSWSRLTPSLSGCQYQIQQIYQCTGRPYHYLSLKSTGKVHGVCVTTPPCTCPMWYRRMRCRWVAEISSRPVIRGNSSRFREEKPVVQTPPTHPVTTNTTATPTPTRTSSKPIAARNEITLEEKVSWLQCAHSYS